MRYQISGQGELEIKTIILDLNGTLSVAGKIDPGVRPRLGKLREAGFKIVLFTGNTRGDAEEQCRELGIEWLQAASAEAKADEAKKLDPDTCASIGNGLIDIELMKTVKLRIVTLQAEGVHVQTLLNSDIVVPTFCEALDLFIDPDRLIATLRR